MVGFSYIVTTRVNEDTSVVMPFGWKQMSRCPGRVGRQLDVEVTLNQEGRLALVGDATGEGESRRTGWDDLVLAWPLLEADVVLSDTLDRPEFLRCMRRVCQDRAE